MSSATAFIISTLNGSTAAAGLAAAELSERFIGELEEASISLKYVLLASEDVVVDASALSLFVGESNFFESAVFMTDLLAFELLAVAIVAATVGDDDVDEDSDETVDEDVVDEITTGLSDDADAAGSTAAGS